MPDPIMGPLKGVRVIEMGSLIAGPYAGALFAQFGAEVIKIEPPGIGDPLRKWRKNGWRYVTLVVFAES